MNDDMRKWVKREMTIIREYHIWLHYWALQVFFNVKL
jgi:hypothetical protein